MFRSAQALCPELIERGSERGLELYRIVSHRRMFLIIITVLELYNQSFLILGEMLILVVCGIAIGMLVFSYLLMIN